MPYAADRLKKLQESVIRSITRYAMEKGAVLLAQGFPDFEPPDEVLAAAEKAMHDGWNQYGMTWGLPALRQAIAEMQTQTATELADPQLRPACRKTLVSLQEHWEGLTRFVDDPRIPMDNNGSERRLRGPAVARKNF